jgi:hypothetical protein
MKDTIVGLLGRCLTSQRPINEHGWYGQSEIIFSDECYIYLGDKQGCIYVTWRADEVLLDECLVSTFKQSLVCVMV